MSRLSCWLLVVMFAALPGASAALRAQDAPTFVVVVHPTNATVALTRTQLGDLFLKRTTTWPSGFDVLPVDLAPKLPARREFSRAVLSLSTAAVTSYWMQEIFSDRKTPPPVLSNADAVVQFVAQTPGAIGYVPLGTTLDKVRVLTVLP